VPGPVYVPGAKNTSGPPPPKPVVQPWVTVPTLPNANAATVPAEALHAWRGLWHAIGSNLPYYINNSRASRRSMNRTLRTHG
jgi:hypothetical protein